VPLFETLMLPYPHAPFAAAAAIESAIMMPCRSAAAAGAGMASAQPQQCRCACFHPPRKSLPLHASSSSYNMRRLLQIPHSQRLMAENKN
jgi:hypothetical protein